tara:strand:+ start:1280 stop:1768 length:489 start_codon:yes stop_codon:yes gene_type:complete
MSENTDLWKVSESKKRKLKEDLDKPSYTGTYIFAWFLLFGSTNLMALGVGMFLLEYVEDSSINVSTYMWTFVISSFLFLLTNSYIIYVKIFPKLNIEKVFKWLLGLGTLLNFSNIGNTNQEIRDMGLDADPFMLAMISLWIAFLFFFTKLNSFKDLEEENHE